MRSIRFSARAAVCAILFATPLRAQDVMPGDVAGSYDRFGNIVNIRTTTVVLRLEFCTSAVVRVRYGFSAHFVGDEDVMLVKREWPPVRLIARDAGDYLVFSTDRVSVRVAKSPLRVSFHRRDGSHPVAGDDPRPGGGMTRLGARVRNRMRLSATEQFFGFGERMDRFAWRGHTVTLNVGRGENPDHDLGAYRIDAANYCPVPFFISTDGYGASSGSTLRRRHDRSGSTAGWRAGLNPGRLRSHPLRAAPGRMRRRPGPWWRGRTRPTEISPRAWK